MNEHTATKLMLLTVPPQPCMRLTDTQLDYWEVRDTTQAMLALIKDHYDWDWPSKSRHLRQNKHYDDLKEREKHPDRKEYAHRKRRWKEQRLEDAENDKEWIKCALISARTLDYLQTSSEKGQSLLGTHEGSRYSFNPKGFYEYTWMCLNQGRGTRSWKQEPAKPGTSETDLGSWYRNKALAIVENVIARWNGGEKLDKIIQVVTSDNVFGKVSATVDIKNELNQIRELIDHLQSKFS